MMVSTPLVSVVMSNYNTPENYLRTALKSVLAQTYRNFEFIIIDDASTGNDVEIIESFGDDRIVLLKNDVNRHVSFSVNRGLKIARGKYIARMDSDDICLPQRFERQVAFMEKHPNVDILSAQTEFIGAKQGLFAAGHRSFEDMATDVFFGCPIVNPTVMLRASFLTQYALEYSTEADYIAAEDYEFWTRCIFKGRIREYPEVLLQYRMHPTQISTASRSLQFHNANRVRQKMLALLGIDPDMREITVHFNFCTGDIAPEISLQETEAWAARLLAGNGAHHAFPEKIFRHKVFQHYFVILAKSVAKKQVPLGRALRLGLTRRALLPAYYPDYIRRYLFSKRFNRS